MANKFARALKHLKSSQIDERIDTLSEALPTNNTQNLMTITPSVETEVETEVTYLNFATGETGDDGENTSGLFLSDGTILTIEPPGDTSYVLGPMSSMWYAWGNFTRIGYIRESDRKMVNLASLTGELGDWDGSADDFTSYGQLTLAQADWFRTTAKKDGADNDTPNYRAFYPGPPSNTPDEYGRYLCVITGTPKDFPGPTESRTSAPGQGEEDATTQFSALLNKKKNEEEEVDEKDVSDMEEYLESLPPGVRDDLENPNKEDHTLLNLMLAMTKAGKAVNLIGAAGKAINKWWNKGKNQRVPGEDSASWKTLLGDDLSQITRSDAAFQAGATGVKGANPFKAFTPKMVKTGPTAAVRQAGTRLTKPGLSGSQQGSQQGQGYSTDLSNVKSDPNPWSVDNVLKKMGAEVDQTSWGSKKVTPPTKKFSGMKGNKVNLHVQQAESGMYPNMTPEKFKEKYGITPQEYMNLPHSQSKKKKSNDLKGVEIAGLTKTEAGVMIDIIKGGKGNVQGAKDTLKKNMSPANYNKLMLRLAHHKPQGQVLSEGRKWLREIRKPVDVPELPKKLKVKPQVKKKEGYKIVGEGLMKDQVAPPEFSSTRDNRMWRKYEMEQNKRSSQEKKNQVLEKIGEGDHQWNYMVTNENWRTSEQMKKFYGTHDDLYTYYHGGKKHKIVRKEGLEKDFLLFVEDENGIKDTILQSELNDLIAYERDQKDFKGHYLYETEQKEREINFDKVNKIKKVVGDVKRGELAPEYPKDPPPKTIDGWHPKLGKNYKHDKLDPQSAEAMPATGDPEIDVNIEKATDKKAKARKVKVLAGKTEQFSNWRDELTDA